MPGYDNSNIRINGKEFDLIYSGRNGSGYGVPGFAFNIYEDGTDVQNGQLRVLVFTSPKWKNNTKFPYTSSVEAENTVRLAIDAVIPTLNLQVESQFLDNLHYYGDHLLIQITESGKQLDEDGTLTLTGYGSPEEFVQMHLYPDKTDKQVRDAILKRISRWELRNHSLRYGTRELEYELFLSRVNISRAVAYLSADQKKYIKKTPAGDDHYNLMLLPNGYDYLEKLDKALEPQANQNSVIPLDSSIYDALEAVNPALSKSYKQAVADLNDKSHISWKGTANELRDTLATLLRDLAPDEKVIEQAWYKPVQGTHGPTQKQRVKYILNLRDVGSKESEVVMEVETMEERIGDFFRKFYGRTNDSVHTASERKEIVRIYGYFLAFARDILDI